MDSINALIADRKYLESGARLSICIDDYPDGIIIPIDKPYRWTSADVIRKIKWAAIHHFDKKNLKVGHAGTLDPLATGVLLVCIGKATRLAETLQKHDKEYIAGITFGATTPSYDLEKEIDQRYPIDGVSRESLEKVIPAFIGQQEQVAPLFSAKSVDGVRAYELARKAFKKAQKEGTSFDHAAVETLSRQNINITEMELLSFNADGIPGKDKEPEYESGHANPRINVTDNTDLHLPHASIRVACSKGTYIRALARDIGESLGSGAHLDSLQRSKSGLFSVKDALTIDETIKLLTT